MTKPAVTPVDERQQYFQQLMAVADGSRNCVWLAQIIASWQVGKGVLPDALALTETRFRSLLAQRFSGYPLAETAQTGRQLDFSRMLEKQDLEQYLRQFADTENPDAEILITLIVAACLGSDHLWQDLGLWSRQHLSDLLQHNFPRLAAANSNDMKWKKFLYKQLCEAEGIYVCRAPSCEVCLDYPQCFAAED